jgi:hypothetical protein
MRRALASVVLLLGLASSPVAMAAAPEASPAPAAEGQRTYPNPQAAVSALVSAVKSGTLDAMLPVLGPQSRDIVTSGDAVADRNGRKHFLQAYGERHALMLRSDGSVWLRLGKEQWPFPIPLVKHDKQWAFDTAAGRDEIINRRIGFNELNAIKVCQTYVQAQREYAARDRQGDLIMQYATHMLSSPDKRDGLYWPVPLGEELSPLGPLVAQAEHEGYEPGKHKGNGFHGYHFKILTRQGAHAPGGAYDYMANGHMVGGFALVAYPVQYGESGIMTFLVNSNGIVWQKDLGADTAQIVGQMTEYDPDESWKKI